MPATPEQAKRSDASCFAPRADKYMPAALLPPCAACGRPSIGGTFLEFDAALTGRQIGVVKFSDACDGPFTPMLVSKHLFPGWKVIRVIDRGIWKLRKLTEEEQNEACSDGS